MRTFNLSIALVALAACATANPNERPATEERVVLSGSEGNVLDMTIQRDNYVQGVVVEAPLNAVWPLLPGIYADLGLPVPATDPSIWTVAVQNHVAMRQIGDQRMSRLIDCGNDITGALADKNRIRLSLRTWLEPAESGTRVRTRLDATATSVEGRAGTTTCVSRGELENRILQSVRARVAG